MLVVLGFALGVLVLLLAALALGLWSLRAVWARLRGRPLPTRQSRWAWHMRTPGGGFGAGQWPRPSDDVVDVSVREVSPETAPPHPKNADASAPKMLLKK
ncbi:MAG: hypothetical protein Fur007_18830 [Rhodoferax sp.]